MDQARPPLLLVQSERSHDCLNHREFSQSEPHLAAQSPATFLGFPPQVRLDDKNMLYWQN